MIGSVVSLFTEQLQKHLIVETGAFFRARFGGFHVVSVTVTAASDAQKGGDIDVDVVLDLPGDNFDFKGRVKIPASAFLAGGEAMAIAVMRAVNVVKPLPPFVLPMIGQG